MPLERARKEFNEAREELAIRKRILVRELLEEALKQVASATEQLKDTEGLVRELPPGDSLDTSRTRGELLCHVQEMGRNLEGLRSALLSEQEAVR